VMGAAAQMMVGSSNPPVNEKVQVAEDDINLANRMMVLNFGDKGEDSEDSK